MLFNAVVFQALATSLVLVSARPASSRPRRQLDGLLPTGILPDSLLEPIASPIGKLASSLIPGGITILPELNTIISEVAKPLSSALPVLAPPLSVVTQIFPISGSPTAAPSGGAGSSGFATSMKPPACTGGSPDVTVTKTITATITVAPKPTSIKTPSPKPTKNSAPAPEPNTNTHVPSSSSALAPKPTSGGDVGDGGDDGCPADEPEPTAAPTSAAAFTSASASATTCGPNFLPCLLEPVASLVKSIVPPITALPALNSAVSQVAAAVSSISPELSTPKEITDKILPV